MKKILLYFFIVFGLIVFNITQASAGCNIVWSGYRSYYNGEPTPVSGSTLTNETSRTPQAAQELFNQSPWGNDDYCMCSATTPSFIDGCYGYSGMGGICAVARLVCTSGTWEYSCEIGAGRCDIFPVTCFFHIGSWDVVCDVSTTTTTQPPTTTTTAPATLINLSSFTATPKFSKVIIQWSTESEIDNAGFNLYRAEAEAGKYIKINSSLIPAQGSATKGASYEFIDTNVQNRKTYYYKLEDSDLQGNSTFHVAVSATPRWIWGLFQK